MINRLAALAQPLLLRLDPERAHDLTLKAVASTPLAFFSHQPDDPRLAVDAFGLRFANPLGLAAGFDKNAEVPERMARFGLGFVEIGTITPLPQTGNPKPRLFRLIEDAAVINRFGFNNEGHLKVHQRLLNQGPLGVPLGINLGANKDSTNRIADYVHGIETFADVAAYFTINVSSPNTPGLRDLQAADALDDLLARVLDTQGRFAPCKPILLKIAPDLSLHELDAIIEVARRRRIDGIIVSNTTISRPASLQDHLIAKETGGLSGQPLFELSTRMLAETYLRVEKQFPLIGVGGISNAETAIAKIEAGASLIQLYTALVYRGPALIGEIKQGLLAYLTKKAQPLADNVGTRASAWSEGKAALTKTL